MSSILEDVASQLGYDSTSDIDAPLLQDMIIHVNMAINNLHQMGVGPSEGFEITGTTETWEDFLGENHVLLNRVKVYIYLKIRVTWDTPTGTVLQALKEEIKEQEWRIVEEADTNNNIFSS